MLSTQHSHLSAPRRSSASSAFSSASSASSTRSTQQAVALGPGLCALGSSAVARAMGGAMGGAVRRARARVGARGRARGKARGRAGFGRGSGRGRRRRGRGSRESGAILLARDPRGRRATLRNRRSHPRCCRRAQTSSHYTFYTAAAPLTAGLFFTIIRLGSWPCSCCSYLLSVRRPAPRGPKCIIHWICTPGLQNILGREASERKLLRTLRSWQQLRTR